MGYAGIFKVGNENQNNGGQEYLFRPRGVSLEAEYEVQLDNRQETMRIPGRELALRGIHVRLESAMTSELLMFKKI